MSNTWACTVYMQFCKERGIIIIELAGHIWMFYNVTQMCLGLLLFFVLFGDDALFCVSLCVCECEFTTVTKRKSLQILDYCSENCCWHKLSNEMTWVHGTVSCLAYFSEEFELYAAFLELLVVWKLSTMPVLAPL